MAAPLRAGQVAVTRAWPEAPVLPRKTFYDKLRRHGISRNDFTAD